MTIAGVVQAGAVPGTAVQGMAGHGTTVHGTAGLMTAAAAEQKRARLTDAAQRFEGMLLQEMLKPMQKSQGMWGEDDPDRDGSLDTMSSYGTEAVANAIAQHGGMGIAKKVVAQVTNLSERTNGQNAQKGTAKVLKFRGPSPMR